LETSAEGVRAVTISLVALGATAIAQAAVVAVTGSVALLGDTLHNVADALTAVPLGIAFVIGRHAETDAELRAVAAASGGHAVRANIGDSDPTHHFVEYVLPALEQLRSTAR
jgi:Cation efflux family